MITQTKPFTPPVESYIEKVKTMFDKQWFTNHGDFVMEFEKKMADYFESPFFLLVTNGTIALQLAIKALELKGDIITTPFSYVATTSSIVWENCNPVFADIKPDTLNIDPNKIRSLITEKTSAILATNVFGHPCDFKAIEEIAKENNLKVIYDNAHGFGVKHNELSTMSFGDISTISFHATKLFHSIEGGGIACSDEKTYKKLILLRNFGHTSPDTFGGLGINAKMNEACAAMGLSNFPFIEEILSKRKEQWLYYHQNIKTQRIKSAKQDLFDTKLNYAYFPLFIESEDYLIIVMKELSEKNIQTRRYFHPSLNKLNYVNYIPCPVSEDISTRILCLPLYHELDIKDQELICKLINEVC